VTAVAAGRGGGRLARTRGGVVALLILLPVLYVAAIVTIHLGRPPGAILRPDVETTELVVLGLLCLPLGMRGWARSSWLLFGLAVVVLFTAGPIVCVTRNTMTEWIGVGLGAAAESRTLADPNGSGRIHVLLNRGGARAGTSLWFFRSDAWSPWARRIDAAQAGVHCEIDREGATSRLVCTE
jgi:hypothetical protein